MKSILTLLILLFSFFANFSQFSRLIQRPANSNSNLVHSAIAVSSKNAGFYAVTSTVITSSGSHISLQKLNSQGSTLWEYEIFISGNDKVLDVVIDKYNDIILTGYTRLLGEKRLYVAKFDAQGSFINDYLLDSPLNSVGTKIIVSKYTDDYYVAGYQSEFDDVYDLQGTALLLSLSSDLTNTHWEKNYLASSVNNTITDVLELPNGNLFLTGSVGQDNSGQDVLALIVDPNKEGELVPSGDLSFNAHSNYGLGASLCYDAKKDEITILFNSGANNIPKIVTFKGVTRPNPIFNSLAYQIDLDFFLDDYAGYQIMLSETDRSKVIIFGYYDFSPFYSSGFGMMAIEMNKYTGRQSKSAKIWNPSAPNAGVEHEGGSVLGLFSNVLNNGRPYFHTPKMAALNHNKDHFVTLTPDKTNGTSEIGVLSYDSDLTWVHSQCIFNMDFNISFIDIKRVDVMAQEANSTYFNGIGSVDEYSGGNLSYCNFIIFPRFSENVSRTNSISEGSAFQPTNELTCYPNPTQSVVQIKLSESSIAKVEVLNSLGQIVFSLLSNQVNAQLQIDLQKFPPSIYLIKVKDKNGIELTKRVIKN